MRPCNSCIQETGKGKIEMFSINPMEGMQDINDPAIHDLAEEVYQKLNRALKSL